MHELVRGVVLVIVAALMIALAALVFGGAAPANNTWSDPIPVDEMTQDEIYEARGAYD